MIDNAKAYGLNTESFAQCARVSLRDRVAGQQQSAEYQGQKAKRLQELLELLDRNPEVARILDLLDEVRG